MKDLSARLLAMGLSTLVLGVTTATAQSNKGQVHAHMAPGQFMRSHATAPVYARQHTHKAGPVVHVPGELRGAPPANDNCSGATLLSVGATCTPVNGTVVGATTSLAALVCNNFEGDADDDVWYRFVATATTHTIQVTGGSDFDAVVDLRSGACNGTNIACADASVMGEMEQIVAAGLTVGNTYYIRVYDFNTGEPLDPTFTICVTSGAPPPPANDDCANAQTLTVFPEGGCDLNATAGDNSNATQSTGGPSCDDATTGIFADVWYSFDPGSNADVELNFETTEMSDLVVSVYDACGGNEVLCAVAPNFPLHLTVDPFANYLLRIHSNTQFGTGGAFALCLSAAGALPPNDECTGATVQALSVPGSVTVNGDNTGATDTEGVGVNTVWEAFTITECANVSVSYCGTAPGFDGVTILLMGCPDFSDVVDSTSTQDCGDGNLQVNFDHLQAGTYYYPVIEVDGEIEGPYTLTFTSTACPPPPANDDCLGAVVLPVGLTCVPTAGDVNNANGSLPAVVCNGFEGIANDDVWYSFVATGITHTITVDAADTLDAVVELFSGDCAMLASLDCSDATLGGGVEELTATDLSPGTTYYVRVYDFYTGYPIASTFTICVTGDIGTGVQDIIAEAVSVRPNPSNGDLTVRYNAPSATVQLQLLDMTGRVVFGTQRALTTGQDVQLSLAGTLAPGNYVLRTSSVLGRSEQRIVVR